jgi:hypothetical protein
MHPRASRQRSWPVEMELVCGKAEAAGGYGCFRCCNEGLAWKLVSHLEAQGSVRVHEALSHHADNHPGILRRCARPA